MKSFIVAIVVILAVLLASSAMALKEKDQQQLVHGARLRKNKKGFAQKIASKIKKIVSDASEEYSPISGYNQCMYENRPNATTTCTYIQEYVNSVAICLPLAGSVAPYLVKGLCEQQGDYTVECNIVAPFCNGIATEQPSGSHSEQYDDDEEGDEEEDENDQNLDENDNEQYDDNGYESY